MIIFGGVPISGEDINLNELSGKICRLGPLTFEVKSANRSDNLISIEVAKKTFCDEILINPKSGRYRLVSSGSREGGWRSGEVVVLS